DVQAGGKRRAGADAQLGRDIAVAGDPAAIVHDDGVVDPGAGRAGVVHRQGAAMDPDGWSIDDIEIFSDNHRALVDLQADVGGAKQGVYERATVLVKGAALKAEGASAVLDHAHGVVAQGVQFAGKPGVVGLVDSEDRVGRLRKDGGIVVHFVAGETADDGIRDRGMEIDLRAVGAAELDRARAERVVVVDVKRGVAVKVNPAAEGVVATQGEVGVVLDVDAAG